MDPISGIIVAGLATLIASSSNRIVSYLWDRYIMPRLRKNITITTNTGERVTIDKATHLSPEKIQEIVATVESQSNTTPSAQK